MGVRTSAKTPYGSRASRCRIGSAKAAVLPLPVCAVPRTSLPCKMAGMQPRCTSVGCTMPSDLHTLHQQNTYHYLNAYVECYRMVKMPPCSRTIMCTREVFLSVLHTCMAPK